MLVSPAEPRPFYALGKVSSLPEKYGADFLITSADYGLVGVQRKEINDFVASARDGRLAREAVQLQHCGVGVILIEGDLRWTDSGMLLVNTEWTRQQHLGTIWSLASRGYWMMSTSDAGETFSWLSSFASWLAKTAGQHSSLRSRPSPPKNEWGGRGSKEWALWVLQGFDGVGSKMAEAIYDHFGGLPLEWASGRMLLDEEDLMQVKGVGKGRAKALMKALEKKTNYD